MQAHERAGAVRVGPLDRFGAELVRDVGGAQPLREVAAAVVHLEEVATVPPLRRADRGARRRTRTSTRRRREPVRITGGRPS